MNLRHIDLPSPCPAATMAFFVRHFGFQVFFERPDGLTVGEDAAGLALTISPVADGHPYPPGFHVGFLVASDAEVLSAWDRLNADGAPVRLAPCVLGGALTFQVTAPGDIAVEVTVRRGPGRSR